MAALDERRLDDAEAELRQAIALDPTNPDLRIGMAATHYLQEDFRQARTDTEEGLQLASDPLTISVALANLADIDTLDGRLGDAEKKLNDAAEAAPDSAVAYFGLATLYGVQGRDAAALEMEQRAMARDPDGALQSSMAYAWPEQQIFSEALAAEARGDSGDATELWTELQGIERAGDLHWNAVAGLAETHLSALQANAGEAQNDIGPSGDIDVPVLSGPANGGVDNAPVASDPQDLGFTD